MAKLLIDNLVKDGANENQNIFELFRDKSTFLKSSKGFEKEFVKSALVEILWFIYLSIAIEDYAEKIFLPVFDRQNDIGEIECFQGKNGLQNCNLLLKQTAIRSGMGFVVCTTLRAERERTIGPSISSGLLLCCMVV